MEHYRGFLLWGVLTGGYFYVLLTGLALSISQKRLRRSVCLLAVCAAVSLGYALMIPYLPDQIPRWAKLHTVCAAGSCVLVMAAMLLLLIYRRKQGLLAVWLAIAALSGLLFFAAGMVTSALEVFFTIAAELLLRELWVKTYT